MKIIQCLKARKQNFRHSSNYIETPPIISFTHIIIKKNHCYLHLNRLCFELQLVYIILAILKKCLCDIVDRMKHLLCWVVGIGNSYSKRPLVTNELSLEASQNGKTSMSIMTNPPYFYLAPVEVTIKIHPYTALWFTSFIPHKIGHLG